MTQPAAEQPVSPEGEPLVAAETVATMAVLLAVGAGPEATARQAAKIFDLGLEVLTRLMRLALSKPVYGVSLRRQPDVLPDPEGGPSFGSAASRTKRAERTFRAAYVVKAAERVRKAQREAGETRPRPGQPTPATDKALERERQIFQRHLEAQEKRAAAAALTDEAGRSYGRLLGWYAVMDPGTTAECRAANGANFYADRRPGIGFPGTVHMHCRCRPGPPHSTRKMVDGQVARWRRRAGKAAHRHGRRRAA